MAAHSELDELLSIKARVLKKLKEDPLLKPKTLCKLLDLNYNDPAKGKCYKSYVQNIRSEWLRSPKFQQGSKVKMPSSFHKARGWVYVDRLNLKIEDALRVGWIQSRSRNKALLWKDPKFGRMVWFPTTGRVNLFIKSPALKGRVFQLFCNGFSMTGLVTSMTILDRLLESIRLKGAHAVFETSQRLPYIVIDLFKLSNGVIFRSGDKSHPTAYEVEFCYPDFAEQNERLLKEIHKMLRGEPITKKPERLKPPKQDYTV